MSEDDWLERAATLLGVRALDGGEMKVLLDLARDVAHGTERRNAPLTSFLLGVAIGGAGPEDRATSVSEQADRLHEALPH